MSRDIVEERGSRSRATAKDAMQLSFHPCRTFLRKSLTSDYLLILYNITSIVLLGSKVGAVRMIRGGD